MERGLFARIMVASLWATRCTAQCQTATGLSSRSCLRPKATFGWGNKQHAGDQLGLLNDQISNINGRLNPNKSETWVRRRRIRSLASGERAGGTKSVLFFFFYPAAALVWLPHAPIQDPDRSPAQGVTTRAAGSNRPQTSVPPVWVREVPVSLSAMPGRLCLACTTHRSMPVTMRAPSPVAGVTPLQRANKI